MDSDLEPGNTKTNSPETPGHKDLTVDAFLDTHGAYASDNVSVDQHRTRNPIEEFIGIIEESEKRRMIREGGHVVDTAQMATEPQQEESQGINDLTIRTAANVNTSKRDYPVKGRKKRKNSDQMDKCKILDNLKSTTQIPVSTTLPASPTTLNSGQVLLQDAIEGNVEMKTNIPIQSKDESMYSIQDSFKLETRNLIPNPSKPVKSKVFPSSANVVSPNESYCSPQISNFQVTKLNPVADPIRRENAKVIPGLIQVCKHSSVKISPRVDMRNVSKVQVFQQNSAEGQTVTLSNTCVLPSTIITGFKSLPVPPQVLNRRLLQHLQEVASNITKEKSDISNDSTKK